MSTFLELAIKLRKECGVTGTDATTVNATGEWGRLCGWIVDSWIEIQDDQTGWEWMRKTVTFNTVSQQGEYTPVQAGVTDLGSWKEKSFRAYPVSAGVGAEQVIKYKPYSAFRDQYLLSSMRTTYSRPIEITVSPSKSLILGFAPNEVYVVSGEYYKAPVTMTLDADTPDMPAKFHLAIVHRAKMKYGIFESASEVYDAGKEDLRVIMNSLRQDQLPKMTRR